MATETTKAVHTPTPWTIGERARLIVREVPGMCDGGDYYTVAETKFHGLLFEDEAAANAAFIINAVNNHDALMKALQAIADYSPASTVQPVAIAREALALAA